MSELDQSPHSPDGTVEDGPRRRVLEQIGVWRKELINFAKSNRLLYFKHTKSSTLELVLEPDEIGEVVTRLIAGGSWRFQFPPEPDELVQRDSGASAAQLFPDDVPGVPEPGNLITNKTDAGTLRNALRLLDRRATQEFMDKGIWILYLAAGVLRWTDVERTRLLIVRWC